MSSRRREVVGGPASRVERENEAWQYAAELPIGTRVFALRSRQLHYGVEHIFKVSAVVSKYRRRSDPWEYNEEGNIAGLEVANDFDTLQINAEDVQKVPSWFNPEHRVLERVQVDGEDGEGEVMALECGRDRWYALVDIGGREIEVDADFLYVPLRRSE